MPEYGMCNQTVTVYRKTKEGICRKVIHNCCLQWAEKLRYDRLGRCVNRNFLLIQPGVEQLVFPGDRVYDGVGRVVDLEDWEYFLPIAVPGLGEVAYATPYQWKGVFCHTEAGRK